MRLPFTYKKQAAILAALGVNVDPPREFEAAMAAIEQLKQKAQAQKDQE